MNTPHAEEMKLETPYRYYEFKLWGWTIILRRGTRKYQRKDKLKINIQAINNATPVRKEIQKDLSMIQDELAGRI